MRRAPSSQQRPQSCVSCAHLVAVQGRVKTMPICESSREDVISSLAQFLHPANIYKVLIISYETFRLHAERFKGASACDLLMCDEAHRLKNDATLTNKALSSLQCKRRVLLSGTPMQNHLDEFYAMVDFCNPGVLGSPSEFRKRFEAPILAAREPDATDAQVTLGEERSAVLSSTVNAFILRRTNALLSKHLPPKVIEVVCCRLTPLQQSLYRHFLQSKEARRLLSGRSTGVLPAITALKKLCNHPKLIYDAVHSKVQGEDPAGAGATGFEGVGDLFPYGVFDDGRSGRGGMAVGWETLSGKMAVTARMLHALFTTTDDRIVIVSNYTQTLDLFTTLCRERGYPCLRLDGSTTISKRQKLVKIFNDPLDKQFVFLLSSAAGGCGLNLIGGNRLILFDPAWNPAVDKQAAARVWRDGQKKRVFVYRFLSSGSIEEKVFQRQLSKEGLQSLVNKNGKAVANVMSSDELKELFSLQPDTLSNTYESMCGVPAALPAEAEGVHAPEGHGVAMAQRGAAEITKAQEGDPSEDDLKAWGHHSNASTVADPVMAAIAGEDVSFIFSCQVAGMHIDESPAAKAAVRTHAQRNGMGSGGASIRQTARPRLTLPPSATASTPTPAVQAATGTRPNAAAAAKPAAPKPTPSTQHDPTQAARDAPPGKPPPISAAPERRTTARGSRPCPSP
ncbi:MAG: hypothetical protein WDW36_005813 [Sanguina aurantia]